MTSPTRRVLSDQEELARTVALAAIDTIATIQAEGSDAHGDGEPRVVVTGGRAGIAVLEELARLERAAAAQADSFPATRIDWSRLWVFFGDERAVPVTHPESNPGQARAALLNEVPIPEARVVGIDVHESDRVDAAARNYAAAIEKIAPEGFDLHLLGLGPEGHVNSLFPGSAATAEDEALTAAVHDSPKPPPQRVTLTLPAVRRADRVWLLAAGEEKREAARLAAGDADPNEVPAAGARGRAETVLFLTEDAAG